MSDVDSIGRKVLAHKNDALKDMKAAHSAIEEDFLYVTDLLNCERKRKHDALEDEERGRRTMFAGPA